MQKLIVLLALNLLAFTSWTQTRQIDSLKNELTSIQDPKEYILTLHRISGLYNEIHLYDSSEQIAQLILAKSLDLGNDSFVFNAYLNLGNLFDSEGDFYLSLNYGIKALKLAQKLNSEIYQAMVLNNVAWAYTQMGDYRKGIDNSIRSTQLGFKNAEDQYGLYIYVLASNNAAIGYMGLNQPDSALYYNRQANEANKTVNRDVAQIWVFGEFVEIYQSLNQLDSVDHYYRQCIALNETATTGQIGGNDQGVVFALLHYSRLLNRMKRYEEAKKYSIDGFNLGLLIDYKRYLIEISR